MTKKERIEQLEGEVQSLHNAIGRIWEWIEAPECRRNGIIQEREFIARRADAMAKELLKPSFLGEIVKVHNSEPFTVKAMPPEGEVEP